MTLWNVSMVMAPNLFPAQRHRRGSKAPVVTAQEEMEEAVGGAYLVRLMITHQDLLWTVSTLSFTHSWKYHAPSDITCRSYFPTGAQLSADSGETHDPGVQSEVGWPGPNQEEAASAAQELQLGAGKRQTPPLSPGHQSIVQLDLPVVFVCVCV